MSANITGNKAETLAWDWGTLTVERHAGRLAELSFILPGGRVVSPFAPPPWLDRSDRDDVSPLLERLRGEWPCVPFGFDEDRLLTGEWRPTVIDTAIDLGHGFGSWNGWEVVRRSAREISLAIDYPLAHPIARLERTITPDPGAPAVELTLTVIPRRTCDLPIGLHPIFDLPAETGAATIDLGSYAEVTTFPGLLMSGSNFVEDYRGTLRSVRLRDGSNIDARRIPFENDTVELVQVLGSVGRVALHNRAALCSFHLQWQPEHFPSVLLWYSNRGHKASPWNGQHLAIGIEPICSAFDLGTGASTTPNPLSRRGWRTSHHFEGGVEFSTSYRLSGTEFAGNGLRGEGRA